MSAQRAAMSKAIVEFVYDDKEDEHKWLGLGDGMSVLSIIWDRMP